MLFYCFFLETFCILQPADVRFHALTRLEAAEGVAVLPVAAADAAVAAVAAAEHAEVVADPVEAAEHVAEYVAGPVAGPAVAEQQPADAVEQPV